jgi:hypothetical protein
VSDSVPFFCAFGLEFSGTEQLQEMNIPLRFRTISFKKKSNEQSRSILF